MIVTPDILGMLFHVARDHVMAMGLDLEGDDPDGPPIMWSAWPGHFLISTQSPPAGTQIHRGQSIRVTFVSDDDNKGRVPVRPVTPLPHLSEGAEVAPGDG